MIGITQHFDDAQLKKETFPLFGEKLIMTVITLTQNAPGYNSELAGIFHRMASCYRYLDNEHRFRCISV